LYYLRKIFISILILLNLFLAFSQEKPTIAVIPFKTSGILEEDAFGFTILFETALQNTPTFIVIEHTDISELLEAQEYSISDLTDDKWAVKLGKLLAAQHLVLGTIGKIEEQYYINVKIIEIETGKNLNAKKVVVNKLSELLDNIDTLASELTGVASAEIKYESSKKTYQITKRTTYSALGKLIHYYTYEYNSKGFIAKRYKYKDTLQLAGYSVYKYDSKGREIKLTEYDLSDKILRYQTYEYDANSRKIKGYLHDEKGRIERYFLCTYDTQGKLVKQAYYNLNGSLFSYYTFIYDVEGRELMSSYYDAWSKHLSYNTSEYLIITN